MTIYIGTADFLEFSDTIAKWHRMVWGDKKKKFRESQFREWKWPGDRSKENVQTGLSRQEVYSNSNNHKGERKSIPEWTTDQTFRWMSYNWRAGNYYGVYYGHMMTVFATALGDTSKVLAIFWTDWPAVLKVMMVCPRFWLVVYLFHSIFSLMPSHLYGGIL